MSEYALLNRRSGTVLAPQLELANSPLRRMCGLLGRRSLPQGGGMRFEPGGSIHTFFMRFTIDVVFLDREGHVAKLVPDLRPWRFTASRGASSVVELPAETIARHDVRVGDPLAVQPLQDARLEQRGEAA